MKRSVMKAREHHLKVCREIGRNIWDTFLTGGEIEQSTASSTEFSHVKQSHWKRWAKETSVLASILMGLAFGLTACGDKNDASHYSSTGMFSQRTGGDVVIGGK